MRRVLRGVAEGEDDLGGYLDPRRPVRRRRSQGGPQPELAANGESPQNRGGAFQAPPRLLLAQDPSHNIAEHVYPARETIPNKY